MTRPWPGAPAGTRGRALPLVFTLVSGAATAGYAAVYLPGAWDGATHCSGSGAAGCATHPFWGFSPALYLGACLLGVTAGVLVAGVGAAVSLGRLDAKRAAYAAVGLSAVGVIAYGGLGVGTVTGVLAGWLLLRGRRRSKEAPAAWDGSSPPAVAPAPSGSRRPLTNRPPVTEWKGIFATAPLGPPVRGRSTVSLPSADNLSAALERSRAPPSAGRELSQPSVVVLPPPPLRLTSVLPAPARAAPAPPRPAPPISAGPTAPGRPPHPGPAGAASTAPPPRPVGAAMAPPSPASQGPPSRPAASGPLRGGWRSPAPPPASPAPSRPAAPPGSPAPPPLAWPAAPRAPPATSAAPRPPPPTGPLPKPRKRAWSCPKCGLVNAPWSPRCTRCRTEPPPVR